MPGKSHGQRSLVGYSPWGRKSQPGARHVSHTPAACSFPGEKARSWVQLFSPGYPATPETVLKPERGSYIYILTWSWLVKGTKFSTSLPPYVGFAFLYPIRDQHRKPLFPRGSTRPIPKLLFSQMVRCESVTLSLIVVVYVYSYVY